MGAYSGIGTYRLLAGVKIVVVDSLSDGKSLKRLLLAKDSHQQEDRRRECQALSSSINITVSRMRG